MFPGLHDVPKLERVLERSMMACLLGLFRTERLAREMSAVTRVIDILKEETKKKNTQRIWFMGWSWYEAERQTEPISCRKTDTSTFPDTNSHPSRSVEATDRLLCKCWLHFIVKSDPTLNYLPNRVCEKELNHFCSEACLRHRALHCTRGWERNWKNSPQLLVVRVDLQVAEFCIFSALTGSEDNPALHKGLLWPIKDMQRAYLKQQHTSPGQTNLWHTPSASLEGKINTLQ